jgi:4,5-dihydroxyphthalate decarboxylase
MKVIIISFLTGADSTKNAEIDFLQENTIEAREGLADLRITLACWDYDRTEGLRSGKIKPEGIDLNCITLPVQETFFRMLKYFEFDASEMSLASYCLSLEKEEQPMVAIPVFLSRVFRHSGIYVNTDSNIEEPKDLLGKKVGTAEWQLTAGVWIRGILSDYYGVPLSSVTYYTGGEEKPGRKEKIPIANLPKEIKLLDIGPEKTLSTMLENGEIDALYSPRTPSCYGRSGKVKRLFQNPMIEEERYYRDTKIFPIMHTVVLRRDIYDTNPWIARSLYKAFEESKKLAAYNFMDSDREGALKIMDPWLSYHSMEIRELMGKDYWPYGLNSNRHVVDKFLKYAYEQGLSKVRHAPEDLFAKESKQAFTI